MQQITYKGFPVTFTPYYQPKEPEVGMPAHWIIEDIFIFGIDPDDLLGEDGMNELVDYIAEQLDKNKNSYHG